MTYLPSDVDIDNIRGRSSLLSKTNLRDSSIFLSFSSISCYEHIIIRREYGQTLGRVRVRTEIG